MVYGDVRRELSFLLMTPEQNQQAEDHDRFSLVSCFLFIALRAIITKFVEVCLHCKVLQERYGH